MNLLWPELGAQLCARQQTLLLIEASAGGVLSAAATAEPGASAWFVGGLVAYSDALKQRWLGLDPLRVERYGAVSQQVAADLVAGAPREIAWVFAETGIYGPGGARPGKPVGTIWVALRGPDGRVHSEQWALSAQRATNRSQMQTRCADFLLRQLQAAAPVKLPPSQRG